PRLNRPSSFQEKDTVMLPPETVAQGAAGPAPADVGEFEALLNKEFKARDTQKQTAVQNAIRTLAQQALASTQLISADVTRTVSAMIAEIDRKLSEQINRIMHHEDFKALEGTWRGLHHLVNNTETDEMLKIRVLNISKNDLKKTLKKFEGTAWDQSPLFKKLYEDEFGSPGGHFVTRRTRAISVWLCPGSCPVSRTGRKRCRWRNSRLRRIPKGRTITSTSGPMPPSQWA